MFLFALGEKFRPWQCYRKANEGECPEICCPVSCFRVTDSRQRIALVPLVFRWLSRTKEKQANRPFRGPPSTFFEPDAGAEDAGTFPPEIYYVLKNVR